MKTFNHGVPALAGEMLAGSEAAGFSGTAASGANEPAKAGTTCVVAEPAKAGTTCLAEIRAKLERTGGQQYWRSLEELAETKEFKEMLHREFPAGASEWWEGVSRRNFLKLAAASLALSGVTACTKQQPKNILPYVNQPEGLVLGEPLFYATAMLLDGFGTGVLVKSYEGHPVKVDGNPQHPDVLGASNIWMQASILDLYDPDRSQSVAYRGDLSTWPLFVSALNRLTQEQSKKRGAGLRFLSGSITSPTLGGQLQELLRRFPEAKWHQYEPITRDNVHEGARLAFGEVVEADYRFDQAAVIVSLDSDFLYAHPGRLRYTRQFTNGRRVSAGNRTMNRLYVVESTPTITGSMADERLPLESGRIESMARAIARELGSDPGADEASTWSDIQNQWLKKTANDLKQHRGSSIVIAGEGQPPAVHALAHRLNAELGNEGKTVVYLEPAESNPGNQLQSLRELVTDMSSGRVEALFILGGNPVVNSPADLEFGTQLEKVKESIHLNLHLDETSALCTWHIPAAHYLESWGDIRSFDGTVSLLQPLITPIYHGKTAHELLGAMMQQQPIRSDYEIVRAYWQGRKLWPDFEKGWRKALHDGFVAESASARKPVQLKGTTLPFRKQSEQAEGLELNFRPDPSVWDGRFANNGWLQECPRPLSKLTWDNAVLISPRLAEKIGVMNNDMVELGFRDRAVRGPVWVMPGQAENTVTIHLGYGRSRAGRVGNGVGFDAYTLRGADAMWFGTSLRLVKVEAQHRLVATQTHHSLESPERQIYRAGTWGEYSKQPGFVKPTVEQPEPERTLYNTDEYPAKGYQWGMSIDLTTCIGCNACVIACEAENNIPVVGKEQVARNREMLWLRVDTYYSGGLDNPEFNHMPVPCMHCEHAPCELVCPVEATVHDHEGLNLQVYNRCVGTRFCNNNCPYKVRRFNFFRYAEYHEPSLEPMYNPDVTVRWRGVMEKCTYCIQRISRARIAAEKENRPIRDGEVASACQQACPAEAIIFGNLNDPESKVARLKRSPLDYSMLGQLNTRPRTTYLAKITNGNDTRI